MRRKMPESVKRELNSRRSKKGGTGGYTHSIKCKPTFEPKPCFSNESIKAPIHYKPHICMRLGWWRVSPLPRNQYDMPNKWASAHDFACRMNEPIRQTLYARINNENQDC